MSAVSRYLATTARNFGDGWNRFWFTPSQPLPLAMLRIGAGSVAFWMILTFGFDLLRYFGPSGIVSVSMLERLYPSATSTRFSYLDFAPDSGSLQAMHYAGLAILAAFTLGLWTRITSVLSLVVFLAYFHRGPMLTSVGEPVVALLLFYLCFGPCGACLSIDAWRRRAANALLLVARPAYAATVSTRLIQVHTSLIYFLMFCATLQYNAVWWNGTAVWWLIARPESCLIDLRWLYQFPYVINIWTSSLILFYLAFAVLIWNRAARPLLVAWSIPVWIGTAVLTGLVPFCVAMFCCGLSFVSAEQWQAILRRRTADASAAAAH